MPVKCMICGKELNSVAGSHLKTKHQMTVEEYKKWFPDAQLYTEEHAHFLAGVSVRAKEGNLERIKRLKEKKAQSKEEIIIDKTPIIKETFNISKLDIPKDKIEKEEKAVLYKNSREKTQQSKLQILSYLDYIFDGYAVENNFIVEKRAIYGGDMIYRILTDISIPELKIDLEFPNAFWRNIDDYFYNRHKFMVEDGWIIITIPSQNPSINEISEALVKENIIPG